MQKPEVRVIEYQEDSKPQEINVSSAEAYALMAKYGLSKPNIPEPQPIHNDPNRDLTFLLDNNSIRILTEMYKEYSKRFNYFLVVF